MLAATVGKKQIGKTAIKLGALAVLVVIAVFVVNKYGSAQDAAGALAGKTAEQREEYLLSRGIQVDPDSSVAQVEVPQEFDERFMSYNETLKSDGFDLAPLKGEAVKKCTYTVTNKPELGEDISAVLLVKDDKIVAGHLLNNATGEICSLGCTQQQSVETILPQQPPLEQPEEPEEPVSADAYPTE